VHEKATVHGINETLPLIATFIIRFWNRNR